MLKCEIDLEDVNWECGSCHKCSAVSALEYPFERDLRTSQGLVEGLKKLIDDKTDYYCEDEANDKNPDIRVEDENDTLVCRVEAKYLEGRAFMKSATMLADGLKPKETLVIDEPKLLSYFQCRVKDRAKYGEIPIYVVWKFDRPCGDVGGITIYQNIDVLRSIYDHRGEARKFTRRTGVGDFSGGHRIGVIDKFHYSITECEPIENLVDEINSL